MMTDERFVIEREFDALVEDVWRAWSEAELVSIWYGPGVETIMHHFEFREGGYWHDEMKMGGGSFFGRTDFIKIVPHETLVLHQSAADQNGNRIANPMMPNWPRVMEAIVSLEAQGDKTKMVFSWAPFEASADEIEMFAQMAARMGGGWNSGFDILEAEIKKRA